MNETWVDDAIRWLNQSLTPLPQELNPIDWKSGLSPKTEKLAQHISAFANRDGGGYLAFGLDNEGQPAPLSKAEADEVVKKLGGIALHNLSENLTLEISTIEHRGRPLLLVHVPEGHRRPVRLRGKDPYAAFKRSAGHTVHMTAQEVELLLATSGSACFEEGVATRDLDGDEVLQQLDYDSYFQIMKTRLPDTKAGILDILAEEELIKKASSSLWHITNKGALLFGRDLSYFQDTSVQDSSRNCV